LVPILYLEPWGNSYALVMPDIGSISLDKYIQQKSLTLLQILEIALQLTNILHELHQQNIIHKDIKPANILIHPVSQEIKLIDFSIASLLPRETQEIQSPNILEGTLAYLAPEQTGRMNRGIDYRADFYALGVTLYELFTHQLPFIADDPLEIIHCHIAKIPTSVTQINSTIPETLAAVVAKLMAKNAEDRYQSAVGLKQDLQECYQQLKTTGTINHFPLGRRDWSDRFLIPEKLYGRQGEVETLLNAFERVANGTAELMLVAGFSGIGKTAVVNEVHKPIVRQRGYFIKGKFDQFNRNIPFSAFVQALKDLTSLLLCELDDQLNKWRQKILTAVGDNGQILIEVIPELETIIGKQPPVTELSGSAAQNRFNLLFQKFIEVFTQKEHPLVIFLDDLQWVDSASLQLIKLLMAEKSYLLLLGAYRDNEVSPAHPFVLTVEDLRKSGVNINTITLAPLSFQDTNHLVADTLNCRPDIAQLLTTLIERKTQGNPFFTTQFLKALHQEGLIRFNWDLYYWECDISQVNTLSLTDDVVEFMALQLEKLPANTQKVVKLAACIGNQFDLNSLGVISQQSVTQVAIALWKALRDGLIIPVSETYKFFQSEISDNSPDNSSNNNDIIVTYRFLHDRVQQAAYSLIPNEEKPAVHRQIGELLLAQIPAQELDSQIFAIVNQFNLGEVKLDQRPMIAQLNLRATKKARLTAAYEAAWQYAEIGLKLLDNDWHQQPELSLQLHLEAANAAYLTGNFAQVDQLITIIVTNSPQLLDYIPALEIQIQSLIARNQLSEAIKVARQVLEKLGVILPNIPDQEITQTAMEAIQNQIASVKNIFALPAMNVPEKLAAMHILSSMASAAYIGDPALYPLIVLKQIELSLQFGNTAETAYAYSTYGLILCAFGGKIELGNQAANIALQLMEQYSVFQFKAKIFNLVYPFVRIWQNPWRESLTPLLAGYQAGLESGDTEFAAYCVFNHCLISFFAGVNLQELQQSMTIYGQAIAQLKQSTALNFHQIGQQAVENWLGASEPPHLLTGNIYDERERLPQHKTAGDSYSIGTLYVHKTILAYHFAEPAEALTIAEIAENVVKNVAGTVKFGIFPFYHALILLANGNNNITNDLEQLKNWANFAPMNFQHRCQLIEAEQYRLAGDYLQAIALYDQAIAGAKENQFAQEEALGNELVAKFYLEWGKEKVAASYMQEAYYCYAKWGAKAKTDHLEKRYPQLLRQILQQNNEGVNFQQSLTKITTPHLISQTFTISMDSSGGLNSTLDFMAVIKASQSISGTIHLEELVHQLTQVILQHSGGDRCALLQPDNQGEWTVRAIATLEEVNLYPEKLDKNSNLPIKLIQYVKNSQFVVVIDNLTTDLPVIDDYLQQVQPQSILCSPILNQGKLIGILFLENKTTSGVFTSDRLLIINFLCTQAAISLENARLYQQAQNYAQELEKSQLQIVQNEKMASLGNLVAGIAHEVNNPIGFLNGSISHAQENLQDILDHLALYQEYYPQPVPAITKHAGEIDLEFLWEDSPKLLNSMQEATDRIKSISNSLRTFSRADTD
ncbi:MAG: AAA family ATPase, partial [Microcoleaceae cyanobacterium]